MKISYTESTFLPPIIEPKVKDKTELTDVYKTNRDIRVKSLIRMWILKARQRKITVFLTAEPDDSLKSLKRQLKIALCDTLFFEKTESKDDKMKDKLSSLQLKINGIIQTDDKISVQEAGLQDGDVLEFSCWRNGEWEPFESESYPES